MALNKAKILKSAEKYVIQGKISHAIAEYQKLIKEDPTDLPLVNTLGDLYVRIGNIPEAVRCFSKLAESYDNGGFVVRAIAMYKKVSKIDPGQAQALARLADLYSRQGLNSDARTHYLQLADYLVKKGDLDGAVATYRKITETDPDNAAIDGRLADTYQKLGNKEGAISAYLSAGSKARRKGTLEDAAGYLRKAQDLSANDPQVLLAYSAVLCELGKEREALEVLNRIPLQEFKPEVLETRFNIFLKSGNLAEAEKIAAELLDQDAQFFRLQIKLSNACSALGDFDQAASQLSKVINTAANLGHGPAIESELKNILLKSPDHVPSILELIKLYAATQWHQQIPALMEKAGGIYARYNQLIEAASIYSQLVQLEPNEPVHRENLRQIRERIGNTDQEIELPRLVPDISALSEKFLSEPTLKTMGSGEALDQSGGRELDDHETIDGFIVEGDLFAGYGLYQKAIEQYQRVIDVIPNHIEVREKMRDMYAKNGDLVKAAQECLVLVNIFTARNDSENANRNFTLAYQYDPNLHQEPIYPAQTDQAEAPADPVPEPPKKRSSAQAQSAEPSPKQLEELLQEVDFYLDLNFLSEAKTSIDQYLKCGSSTDSEFQIRMERYQGMVNSQGGGAASAATEAAEPVSQEVEEAVAETAVEEPQTTASPGQDQSATEVDKAAGFQSTSHEDPAAVSEPAETALGESFDEMMIDLEHELGDSTLKAAAAPAPPVVETSTAPQPPAESADGTGLHDVFNEFKEGIEEDSEGGDFDTHYHLGIAFKEMGLLEEAIGEFQKALQSRGQDNAAAEYVQCCNMLGICFSEKGLPQVAIKWFSKGLSSPGQSEETYQALRYDLGCAYQLAGDAKAALETFLDVYGININYRDVSDKIQYLKSSVDG